MNGKAQPSSTGQLALLLAWVFLPLAAALVGLLLPGQLSKESVQQTASLYVAIGGLAIAWFAIGWVPLAVFLPHWSKVKPVFGLVPWFLITMAPIGSWAFETWVLSSGPAAGEPTQFRVERAYRRQARLRALNGQATGSKFVIDTRVADAAQRGDAADKAIRLGRVRRGRLGLWVASFED
ncbi:MAG TPA: hypothetical protein VHO67_14710 [Polyangia bacterium]|nr:hypothetical protein [Polyangia bacterium]